MKEADVFKMIEVVGISTKGFSEAASEAVQALADSGERIHFFEVVEQRGAVRQGRIKEFQVKIKAAAEFVK